MKLFHVETKYVGKTELSKKLIEKLPKSIILAGTIQYREQALDIKKQLESLGHTVSLFESYHGSKIGQILGCDIMHKKKVSDADAFLYIGDGEFHPTALLFSGEVPVICFSPLSNSIKEYTKKDLEKVQQKRKAQLTKFYAAERIGILVTTKPGQNNIKAALKLKEELDRKGKEAFVFLDNTLDIAGLENFPFIEAWVNTACPRIVGDSNMVNIYEVYSGKVIEK